MLSCQKFSTPQPSLMVLEMVHPVMCIRADGFVCPPETNQAHLTAGEVLVGVGHGQFGVGIEMGRARAGKGP